MQLKITNLASVSRKIQTEKNNNFTEHLETPVCLTNIKDIGKMIIMSGTAKRKSFKRTVTTPEKPFNIIKNQYRKGFLKLRAPFYKPRQKQIQTGEKLMSKSCEMLFQYLKPFKHIQIMEGKNAYKRDWNRTMGSILKTTNVVYEKTATRKVEILSVFEENPNSDFNKDTSIFDFLPKENNFLFEYNHHDSGERNRNLIPKAGSHVKENFNVLQKTVSSEDFIINAFSESGNPFI